PTAVDQVEAQREAGGVHAGRQRGRDDVDLRGLGLARRQPQTGHVAAVCEGGVGAGQEPAVAQGGGGRVPYLTAGVGGDDVDRVVEVAGGRGVEAHGLRHRRGAEHRLV